MSETNNNIQLTKFSLASFDKKIYERFSDNILVKERNTEFFVPVLNSTPERWAMLQQHNAILDTNKNPILPLILIKRNNIETSLDASFVGRDKFITYKREIDYKKSMNDTEVVYNIYRSKPPVFTTIEYNIRILTRYTKTINSIIEQLILNHQKFNIDNLRGEMNSFAEEGNVADFNEDIRIISAGTNLTVSGYVMNNDNVEVTKVSSLNKVKITEKTII